MKIKRTFYLDIETSNAINEIADLLKWKKSLVLDEAIKKFLKEFK